MAAAGAGADQCSCSVRFFDRSRLSALLKGGTPRKPQSSAELGVSTISGCMLAADRRLKGFSCAEPPLPGGSAGCATRRCFSSCFWCHLRTQCHALVRDMFPYTKVANQLDDRTTTAARMRRAQGDS